MGRANLWFALPIKNKNNYRDLPPLLDGELEEPPLDGLTEEPPLEGLTVPLEGALLEGALYEPPLEGAALEPLEGAL